MALKVIPQVKTVIINDGKQPLNPHWYAMVKNTQQGRSWVKEFKEKNPHLKVTLRGRHHDRKFVSELADKRYRSGTQNDVPLMYAERLAVYTNPNTRKNYNIKAGDCFDTFKSKGFEFYGLKVTSCNGDYCTADSRNVFDAKLKSFYESIGRTSVILKWSDTKQIWKVYNIFA